MSEYRQNRDGKTCVIWTRVSSRNPNRNEALKQQMRRCEDYAYRNHYIVSRYFGAACEGDNLDRIVKELINYVRTNNNVSTLLVTGIDRFSRMQSRVEKICYAIRMAGVRIIETKDKCRYDRV